MYNILQKSFANDNLYSLLSLFLVFDAGAKLPSGILNGNVNQFGDFDQCLRVQEPSRKRWSSNRRSYGDGDGGIQGKYCLAYLQPTLPEDNQYGSLKYLYDRVQSLGAFRSNFDDVSVGNCEYIRRILNILTPLSTLIQSYLYFDNDLLIAGYLK